jgi:hypothetical protein
VRPANVVLIKAVARSAWWVYRRDLRRRTDGGIAIIGVLRNLRQGVGLRWIPETSSLPRARLNVRISNHTAIRLYKRSQYYQVRIAPGTIRWRGCLDPGKAIIIACDDCIEPPAQIIISRP